MHCDEWQNYSDWPLRFWEPVVNSEWFCVLSLTRHLTWNPVDRFWRLRCSRQIVLEAWTTRKSKEHIGLHTMHTSVNWGMLMFDVTHNTQTSCITGFTHDKPSKPASDTLMSQSFIHRHYYQSQYNLLTFASSSLSSQINQTYKLHLQTSLSTSS